MPTFTIQIDPGEIQRLIDSYRPTQPKMEAIGTFLLQQINDRFASQGASGGQAWPHKRMRDWGYDDGRAILTGVSNKLLESFQSYGKENEAIAFSSVPYSYVHQLGTVGKGGVLPEIKPKNARALFIPITDRAITSDRQNIGGRVTRTANRGPRIGPGMFAPLVKGRLKGGKLQRWDDDQGEYVDGTPDFIFLSRVNIAPRPMLPDSPQETQEAVQFTADVLSGRADAS